MRRLTTTLAADRRGVTALEYGLIAAAVVAVGLAGFSVIGTDLSTKFSSVSSAFEGTDSGGANSGSNSGGGS